MITYTNYSDLIDASLYYLINGEFKPVKVVFAEDYNEADFKGNNQYIKVWCQDSSWVSNNTAGETREYEYSVNYYIRDISKVDRIALPLNWINFGERLDQLLNQNKTLTLDVVYRWHSLMINGSNHPKKVEDAEGEVIRGIKSINKEVFITRTNEYNETDIIYEAGKYDIARFG